MPEILAAGAAAYGELKNLCVWAKSNGGMGSLYRSRHELVFVFKSGTGSHINNVELGRHGRYRTNVWAYPEVNAFGAGREDLALHPTVKPVALAADAILDCSRMYNPASGAPPSRRASLHERARNHLGDRAIGIKNTTAVPLTMLPD